MPNHVHTETHCRLFADDTLLYRVVETISDQVQLQQDLKRLEQWAADCSDWVMVMVFNPTDQVLHHVDQQRQDSKFSFLRAVWSSAELSRP